MDRYDIYTKDDARILYEMDNEYGDWVRYEDADARIVGLESALMDYQRRVKELEYGIEIGAKEWYENRCRRHEEDKKIAAKIRNLEAQLTAAQERNVALQSEHLNHVNALHEQLTAMTAERDSETRWAKQYSDEANELRQQLTAAQELAASYLNALMAAEAANDN